MDSAVGKRFGNYTLVRLLGQGGFASVYLGEHIYLKTYAAIKVLHAQLSEHEREGFLNEARTVAGLKHPHIVRVLEFGVEDGKVPYLVMDFAAHGTLRQRHPKGTRVPLPGVVGYTRQVADALQYAHDRRMVHRDVKPENMLVGEDGAILLSDFGIAVLAQSTRDATGVGVAGTAPYMAPEQIQGRAGPQTDQYALGIVLYEWLSGERPFQGTFIEVMSQHMHAPVPPLSSKVPGIPPDVEHVVMTALNKDPQGRFGSMRAFAHALQQAGGLPETPSTPPPPPFINPGAPIPPNVNAVGMHALETVSGSTTAHVPASNAPYLSPAFQSGGSMTDRPVAGVSRRTIIAGLGGVAALAAVGTVIYTVTHQSPSSAIHVPEKTTSPSAQGTSTSSTGPATTSNGQGVSKSPIYTYTGHSDAVFAVAWSPKESRIASGSSDNTVHIWDATTGGNVVRYTQHQKPIHALAWSPDGSSIVSGSQDGIAQVWQAGTGNMLAVYKAQRLPGTAYGVMAVGWSPDGTYIASGGDDNVVQIWEALTGNPVRAYKEQQKMIRCLAWSPDGTYIASGGDDSKVYVWEARTGKTVTTYTRHSGYISSLAWSLDGQYIISSDEGPGGSDPTIAVGGSHKVQVWVAQTGKHVLDFTPANSSKSSNENGLSITPIDFFAYGVDIFAVASSPAQRSRRVATVDVGGKIYTWDVPSGNNITSHNGTNFVEALTWSPDGSYLAAGNSSKTVQVWQER